VANKVYVPVGEPRNKLLLLRLS